MMPQGLFSQLQSQQHSSSSGSNPASSLLGATNNSASSNQGGLSGSGGILNASNAVPGLGLLGAAGTNSQSSSNNNTPSQHNSSNNATLGGLLSSASGMPHHSNNPQRNSSPHQLQQHQIVQNLCDILVPEKRRHAMKVLSMQREVADAGQMALLLWYSTGVMAVLIQEITLGYDLLSPEKLTVDAAERLCDALVLLQCVASHHTTCPLFLNAHIPLYVYPFLDTPQSSELFERLRLTSLGVIAALFKPEDSKIIRFLLNIEIIPLCLRIMESGSDLNKLLSTFIVEKILSFDDGLSYICATPERFYAVSSVLSNMMSAKPEPRLVKHIIKCYLRLSEHPRAREALSQCLPREIQEPDAEGLSKENDLEGLRKLRMMLLMNVGIYRGEPGAGNQQQAGTAQH